MGTFIYTFNIPRDNGKPYPIISLTNKVAALPARPAGCLLPDGDLPIDGFQATPRNF